MSTIATDPLAGPGRGPRACDLLPRNLVAPVSHSAYCRVQVAETHLHAPTGVLRYNSLTLSTVETRT